MYRIVERTPFLQYDLNSAYQFLNLELQVALDLFCISDTPAIDHNGFKKELDKIWDVPNISKMPPFIQDWMLVHNQFGKPWWTDKTNNVSDLQRAPYNGFALVPDSV